MHAENSPPGHGSVGAGDGDGDGDGDGADMIPEVHVPLSQPGLGWLQVAFNQHLG